MNFSVFRSAHIYKGLLFIIAALIPFIDYFRIQFVSIAIIILVVWWLFNLSNQRIHQLFSNKLIWLFIGLYLINVVNLVQVENLNEAAKILTKKLSILLFPLVLGTSPKLSPKDVSRLLGCFGISLFLISLYSFRNGLTILLDRDNLVGIAQAFLIDRPYFGLFAAFVAVIIFIGMFTSTPAGKFAGLGLFLFFILEIYLSWAKMAFIAIILALVGTGLLFLYYKIRLRYNLFLYSLGLGAIFYFGLTNQTAKNVLTKLQNSEVFSFTEYDINLVASINIRYINWGCSVQAIQENDAWLTGLGPGDVKEHLFPCYKDHNPWIYESKMNAHSEYLEETLRNGVLGLLLLLACFLIPLWLSFRARNFLYFAFILLIMICSLTESLLSRQIGIIFYAFFNSLLAFHTPTGRLKEV
jgi:O-antigen ligase